MKSILVTALVLFSGMTFAEVAADSTMSNSKHLAYATLGYGSHAFILGAEYENAFDRTYGLGAYFRDYAKLDGVGTPHIDPGFFTIGAFIRPHFTRGPWDLSFAPGVAITFINANSENPTETAFGPSLSVMLMYQVKSNLSFGAEYFNLYDWTDSAYRGQIASDLSLKGRYHF
jgi:hypothetical protein